MPLPPLDRADDRVWSQRGTGWQTNKDDRPCVRVPHSKRVFWSAYNRSSQRNMHNMHGLQSYGVPGFTLHRHRRRAVQTGQCTCTSMGSNACQFCTCVMLASSRGTARNGLTHPSPSVKDINVRGAPASLNAAAYRVRSQRSPVWQTDKDDRPCVRMPHSEWVFWPGYNRGSQRNMHSMHGLQSYGVHGFTLHQHRRRAVQTGQCYMHEHGFWC